MMAALDPNQFLEVTRPYLQDGDAAALAQAVNVRWRYTQLCPLLRHPDADVRRVAAVTLGLVGDAKVIGCLTNALRDPDEQVNQMAEHGLWSIWFRSGDPQASKPFKEGVSLLAEEKYARAAQRFEQATHIDPLFCEAHNQCSIAHFFLGRYENSIESCRRAICLVPTHFGAIAGMGHCYTQLGNLQRALACYRRAAQINPRMNAIRRMIARLEHKRGSNDASGIYHFDTAGLR